MEVRERSPVPPLDVLRIYVAAEAGCDGVAVLDRMCARVREADRDRFRLADDAEKLGGERERERDQHYFAAPFNSNCLFMTIFLRVPYVPLPTSGTPTGS